MALDIGRYDDAGVGVFLGADSRAGSLGYDSGRKENCVVGLQGMLRLQAVRKAVLAYPALGW